MTPTSDSPGFDAVNELGRHKLELPQPVELICPARWADRLRSAGNDIVESRHARTNGIHAIGVPPGSEAGGALQLCVCAVCCST